MRWKSKRKPWRFRSTPFFAETLAATLVIVFLARGTRGVGASDQVSKHPFLLKSKLFVREYFFLLKVSKDAFHRNIFVRRGRPG